MDVWDDEPPLPGDPRLETPNLVLTPHAAWYSPDSEAALYERIAETRDRRAARRDAHGGS